MALSETKKTTLCRFAGVAETDTAAVAVLELCYDRAKAWYEDADVDTTQTKAFSWIIDLAAWFYDNRGRSDAVIPPYIVTSVHQLRESEE